MRITSWDVKPFDESGELFQQAGSASGRIWVCYQAAGDHRDSWAQGSFENAPVRYMGKPDLKY